jgi:hypothetical protein
MKLSIVMMMPQEQRPAVIREISELMCGPSEVMYQRLLNFETCRYKNIYTSPYMDLYEMMNMRHVVGAVGPADTVAYCG